MRTILSEVVLRGFAWARAVGATFSSARGQECPRHLLAPLVGLHTAILGDASTFSWDLVADVERLFYYAFMRNAYLAGTLVALVAGIVGYFMTLRGQSFAGHSLANVGFAGATGAALIGAPPVAGLFVAGMLAAFGIQALNLGARQTRQGDIAVGAVLTAALALGFLFLRLTTRYATSVYDVLFGNVLGINDGDVRTIAWTALALLVALAVIARPLLFASVDPDVAAARGVPVRALSFGFLALLALVVAVAVQVVGVLLIFALLVTPAAIAQRLTARPARAIALAVALAVGFTWLGLAVGYFTPYPVGFFISTFAFGAYAAVRGWEFVRTSPLAPLPAGSGETEARARSVEGGAA
jgi:zinc/manganese transport system permease protein